MNEYTFYMVVLVWTSLAVILVPTLIKRTPPYGRHFQTKPGLTIDNKLAWFIMELISLLAFSLFFLLGEQAKTYVTWTFFCLWVLHYGHRSFVYSYRIKTKGKKMLASIMISAIIFNIINGFINGYYLGHQGPAYALSWFKVPEFTIGLSIFILGFIINLYSDHQLINLRKKNQTSYLVPQGGLFRLVSCPNYLGEIIEWGGFALMTQSFPAFSFFIWTLCNLVPRAIANHRWYLENFEDYPKNRKAVFPFVL